MDISEVENKAAWHYETRLRRELQNNGDAYYSALSTCPQRDRKQRINSDDAGSSASSTCHHTNEMRKEIQNNEDACCSALSTCPHRNQRQIINNYDGCCSDLSTFHHEHQIKWKKAYEVMRNMNNDEEMEQKEIDKKRILSLHLLRKKQKKNKS